MPKQKNFTQEELAEILNKTRTTFSGAITGLNSLTDVPTQLKSMVDDLKTSMNAVLAKMPLIDAVPAAEEANWALNSLAYWAECFQTGTDSMMNALNKMREKYDSDLKAKDTAVNGLVKDAIEAAVKKGELFEKSTVEGMVSAAKNSGRDVAVNSIKVTAERKTKLTTAGLPVPDEEAILEGEEAAFTTLQTETDRRVKLLAGKGLAMKSAPDLVKRLAFSKNFDSDLANITEVMKLTGAQTEPLLSGDAPQGGGKARLC